MNRNRIRSLASISPLAQFVPGIRSISLQGNDIAAVGALDFLAGNKKLPNLRELNFLDNPFRENSIKKANGDDAAYRSEVLRKFPTLEVLDLTPVAPAIQFGLDDDEVEVKGDGAGRMALPIPIKAGFMDSPATQASVLAFLGTFFSLWDTDRQKCFQLYDSASTFSLMMQTNLLGTPVSYRQIPGNKDLKSYMPISRNLKRVQHLGKSVL